MVTLPGAAAVGAVKDEAGLLALTLQMATTAAEKSGRWEIGPRGAGSWGKVRTVLGKLGSIALTLRGRPLGGKQKRVVRFAVHDLSCVAPPK